MPISGAEPCRKAEVASLGSLPAWRWRELVAEQRCPGCRRVLGVPGGSSSQQQVQLLGKQRPALWSRIHNKEEKVNCKPKTQDKQEIPFRLREIMRSRWEMKNPTGNKKRKKAAQVAPERHWKGKQREWSPTLPSPSSSRGRGSPTRPISSTCYSSARTRPPSSQRSRQLPRRSLS